jgi:hypothetical protein
MSRTTYSSALKLDISAEARYQSAEEQVVRDMLQNVALPNSVADTFRSKARAAKDTKPHRRNSVIASSSERLNAGDTIYLSTYSPTDGNFFMTSEGGSRPGVYVTSSQPANFQDCLFRICCPLSYASSKSVRKQGGKLSSTAQAHSVQQQTALVHENERNALSLQQQCGLEYPCRYGNVYQLQHVKSGRFLTLLPGVSAAVDRDRMRVELVAGGNDGSHFRVEPMLKMRPVGSSVFVGDRLKLVSLKPLDHCLHATKPPFLNGTDLSTGFHRAYEVNVSEDHGASQRGNNENWDVQWQFHLFTSHVPKENLSVAVGSVVRLFHPQLEAYLSIHDPGKEKKNQPLPCLRPSPVGVKSDAIRKQTSKWAIRSAPFCCVSLLLTHCSVCRR